MNPILLDFPHGFETERLFIRLPKPGDGRVVYPAIQASINELRQWLLFAQNKQSEDQTEANIREAHAKFLTREDMRLHVFHKETGEFVCASGLHNIDWDIPKFEIGYWVATSHSGKGYVTEAVQGITNFSFLELKAKRVEIKCDAKNHKSRSIPERLDFKLEGILRNDDLSVNGNELRDTCIYAKIKNQ
ncbi:Protein N-acetyltransferase, RimJ/RimL family [Salinibacillus kushneri]|uniref:Protein N-acetyltransferase, RimJ/RimL family n=1 Tax=Salinibacillus kushneri TaxID=237682 RepID=A0A1I0JIT6_9BACI|nr:GNAT family N-acetyltransferase [Salinibacillus kushneri]SEU10068.1 Protein N-acetyltransferase, RimJ/RimL family [Salinibacillus kushneri]